MFQNSKIFMSSAYRYKILSYPINVATTPIYGRIPMPSVKPYSQIADGDTSNSYVISMHNHTGTHIDAPKHFVDNGKSISEYLLEELIFKHPMIVDCPKDSATLVVPKDLQGASALFQMSDCLLLRTGFGLFREEERYRTHNPGVAPETILWMRREFPSVKCIGIDSISISSFQHRNSGREAHRAAFIKQQGLGEPLLLIEDMKLEKIERLETLIVLPWQIDKLDSAPCTVIATVKERFI